MALLYALIDPRTDETRYIGVTDLAVWERLRKHALSALRGEGGRKGEWIRELLAESRPPTVKLLAVLDSREEGHRCETAYIRALKAKGVPLTNETGNGAGRVMLALQIPRPVHFELRALALRLSGERNERVLLTTLVLEALELLFAEYKAKK